MLSAMARVMKLNVWSGKNPHDLTKAGGSSGGSAAAVADDGVFSRLAKIPAVPSSQQVCGVVGLRPSYGRNSRYGIMPMASSLDICRSDNQDSGGLRDCGGNNRGRDELDATTVNSGKDRKIKRSKDYDWGAGEYS